MIYTLYFSIFSLNWRFWIFLCWKLSYFVWRVLLNAGIKFINLNTQMGPNPNLIEMLKCFQQSLDNVFAPWDRHVLFETSNSLQELQTACELCSVTRFWWNRNLTPRLCLHKFIERFITVKSVGIIFKTFNLHLLDWLPPF